MTIITDIFEAMHETELKPIGLLFGISARQAFDADSHWTRLDGNEGKLQQLREILPLARCCTNEFQGWSLMLGDSPNPFRPQGRKAA